MIKSALQYQERGFSVIPLRPGTKVPALHEWKSNQTKPWTRDNILEWWSTPAHAQDNIGIVCGRVSGIWVLDVDGPEGIKSVKDAGIEVPDTYTIKTPHGWHFYFRYDPAVATGNGKLPNVDVKSDGSYVVAPPSVLQEEAS